MEKPYVISGEFDLLGNSQKRIMQTNKLEMVRESLVDDLEAMGKNVTWVSAQDVARGINKRVSASQLPVVTLDEVYVTSPNARIGISRGSDDVLNDAGYMPRVGYGSIKDQFDAVALLGPEVQLIDDVVFSGEMMSWVINEFQKRNVRVGRVVCGIAIKEGIELLDDLGIPVESVYMFDDVEDEICERDLFVAKGSGRRLSNEQGNALYFDDKNGRPERWASIPPNSTSDFCLRSLERSLTLLRPDVLMCEVGQFYGYPVEGLAQSAIRTRLAEAR